MARTSPRRTTPPPGSSTFCYWVKRWRSYQGVTQRRFAELWGVSLSLVQKIEADDYSVSQLSFARLETLRTLLGLPSSTFYNLIATQPDTPPEGAAQPTEEVVQIERLEPSLLPVSLPQMLLGNTAGTSLVAFAVEPSDFATEGLHSSLNVGTLVVFAKTPVFQETDVRVALTQHAGQTCRVLLSGVRDKALVLRSFNSENNRVVETYLDDLGSLGVVAAYWVKLSA